jgi:virginiamycin B lyase
LTPQSQPWDITALPDGSFWFTEENVDQIGVIYTDGSIYEYPAGVGTLPTMIATGRRGKVWYTQELGNKIVELTPGPPGYEPKLVEHPLLTDGALPWDITLGPDGNMWFTELAGRNIGKITPAGTITEYPVPGEYGIAGISAGPSDRLWFTENDSSLVGSITTNGVVEQRYPTSPYPFGITSGPDGNMWFCGGYGNTIGRLSLRQAPLRHSGFRAKPFH